MPIKTRKHIVWFVYMLRCRDNSIYTGITTDIGKRIKRHNQGKGAKYTASRRPVELIYYEPHKDWLSAAKREYALKRLAKSKKESLVAGFSV